MLPVSICYAGVGFATCFSGGVLCAGTPMHHAAMANKKEMMFLLARLGCDWRARAEGIDGATAAFVLCGQHGKTTRQQVILALLPYYPPRIALRKLSAAFLSIRSLQNINANYHRT